jgi:DNA-binding CsgD family transcriptional regulator
VRDARKSLEDALDHLADGVILIRRDGIVAFANSAAQDIARRGDGINLHGGKLDLPAAEARMRLDAALAAVLRPREPRPADACDFPLARAGAPPYIVSVRPLDGNERRPVADRDADAIVFVRDPLHRIAAAIGVLREIFRLTDAEAALAQALQTGVPLAAYAKTRGLSLNTVYTHLRRVREKTGCSRMQELIATLNDLHVPLLRG